MARRTRIGALALISLVLSLGSCKAAVADVPQITDFSSQPIIDCNVPLGGRGFLLMITVRHAGPTTSHYVDKIEIMTAEMNKTVDLQPQPNETFRATSIICEGREYYAGEESTVKVRAHCTIHGWGDPSSPITIPEFSAAPVVALVSLVFVCLIGPLARRRRRFVH